MRIDFSSLKTAIYITPPDGNLDNRIEFITNGLYRPQSVSDRGELPFTVLNNYLDTLPISDKTALFALYMDAKDIFAANSGNLKQTAGKLEKIIQSIMNMIDYQRFEDFIRYRSGIDIPTSIAEELNDVDPSFTKARTYLRKDYFDLVVFCVLFRLLMPIWGEDVTLYQESVPAVLREYRSYQLLARVDLSSYPAYERLLTYVEASYIEKPEAEAATAIGGLSNAGIPEWLTAILIVRRLGLISLSPTTREDSHGQSHIVSQISTYINRNATNLPKKFVSQLKVKRNTSGSDADDPSYIESFRTKQSISYGLIETDNIFLEMPIENIVNCIDPSCPIELIREVERVNENLIHMEFDTHNKRIASEVMSIAVTNTMFNIYDKMHLARAMIATQCVLHHWGMHVMALLVTSRSIKSSGTIIGDESLKPTAHDEELLNQAYPYKSPSRLSSNRGKSDNLVYPSVVQFGSSLIRHRKVVSAPSFVERKATGIDSNGVLNVPKSINSHIIQMLFKINQVNKEQNQ